MSLFDADASARRLGHERTLAYLAMLRDQTLLDVELLKAIYDA